MILLVVGIVMMSSASYAWAYSEHDGDGLFYAKSQMKNVRIAHGTMTFFADEWFVGIHPWLNLL